LREGIFMKILVTGGAGYIGSITSAELVRAGHEVIIIDNLYQVISGCSTRGNLH
jgi:UDP-galactose 4-epimerase (EC 5.1.3.2)